MEVTRLRTSLASINQREAACNTLLFIAALDITFQAPAVIYGYPHGNFLHQDATQQASYRQPGHDLPNELEAVCKRVANLRL